MFSRFSFIQQRSLDRFLGERPLCNSGACDKCNSAPPSIIRADNPGEVWYSYRYNPQTGDIEYTLH